MKNPWIKLLIDVTIGIVIPINLIASCFGISIGDLLFFTGAFYIIGWGYLIECITDDPKVLERIKSGK